MSNREAIEQQIREVLTTETHAIPLSEKLFSPNGLFNELAKYETDRRAVVATALFQEAQRRLSAMQLAEAAEFTHRVANLNANAPELGYVIKWEHVEMGSAGGAR